MKLERLARFQSWLNQRGANLTIDGIPGPATRAAIIEVFRNTKAPAVKRADMVVLAYRLGCTVRQLDAVGQVEGGGAGWDRQGLLKCLFERHYAWRRLRVLIPGLSNPKPGGYTNDANRNGINDSWEKLADLAMTKGAATAFECASFGRFQIMGAHWKSLGYRSVLDFVWKLSRDEAAHFDALAKFIEVNGLTKALRAIDGNPDNCRAFAKGYNGRGYAAQNYHVKIANAWRAAR